MKLDNVVIRSAALQDLNALVDLENECFTADKMTPAHYRRLLKTSSAETLIAEISAKPTGCLVVLFRRNSSRARIYSLAVAPLYRQAGIAKKLCNACEEISIQRNCSTIFLEVRPDNHVAINFYKKNGYEIFGSYNKFYEDGTNALRMKKIL